MFGDPPSQPGGPLSARIDEIRRRLERFQPGVGFGAPEPVAAPAAPMPVADSNDVLREQLEFLIDHAACGIHGCRLCDRYQRVRGVLLEPFA